jgi:FMN reductase
MSTEFVPHIVGVGGTLRPNSSSELAMRQVLRGCQVLGASTEVLSGADLVLPMYSPQATDCPEAAQRMLAAFRRADGIVLSSPAYHGSISGLLKNALDFTEDMRTDRRVYWNGRAVGCISCGGGVQAAAATLSALRSITHALRGWPTPLGILVNTSVPVFDETARCVDPLIEAQFAIMAEELVQFANCHAAQSSCIEVAI